MPTPPHKSSLGVYETVAIIEKARRRKP